DGCLARPPFAPYAWSIGRSMGGLAADEGDRYMPHRRIGLGAVPMAFAGLDVHDIADVDLALFLLRRDHAGARGDDQDLVAVMRMPSRSATLAEVHHAAVVVRGVPRLNDRLTRPGNRPSPPFDRLAAFRRDSRYVLKRDYLHNDFPPALTDVQGISNPRGIIAEWLDQRSHNRRHCRLPSKCRKHDVV